MKLYKLLVSLAGALAISGAAEAAIYTGSTGSPANVVSDYSTGALVSFDLDLQDLGSTKLNFLVEEDDLALPYLSLNAIVRNLSGDGFRYFSFSLEGISFAAAGSVTPTFGAVGQVVNSGNAASIDFSAPEWAEFHFGNPFALAGKDDWLLSTAGLQAGDAFSITASVPEPATLTLMLSALAMFGFAAALRDKR